MKNHIGSTIALSLGILSFAGSIASPVNPRELLVGPFMVLGALAYSSAKKRMLGEVKTTLLRKGLELLALVIIVAAVVLQNNLKELIATEPFSNVIVPLWAIIAYIIIVFKSKKAND